MKQIEEMQSLTLHRKIFVLFIGASVLFNLLYFSASYFSFIGYLSVASSIYQFFSPLCHQLDSRSFSLFGHPLAVCARCTGIYLGFLAGLVTLLLTLKEPLRAIPKKKYFYVLFAPAMLDFLLNFLGILSTPSLLRAFTGFMIGMILPFYIMPGICEIGSQWVFGTHLLNSDKSIL